ncbi:MAG TPA: Asp23/Gls24 family envelope stress response protein [Pseudonocardiaceae bacterium]|nr:Asp23/Gls24 family envelope stress response protein [Pseudonocardiaceae bacterium]
MPSPTTPADGAPTPPQLHVSDTVVARVAAYHACRVPGVFRLRPNLAQSMASIATRLFPPRDGEHRIPTDGVTAVIEDGHAEISIVLITRWGHNCRDIAEQVQAQVAEEVHSYTGLPATVTITITDVSYDD